MDNYIFKDFLDNKEVYKENVNFWDSIISDLLTSEHYKFDSYIATSDGFGNEFYDGNPIFNFKIDRLNKAVRIIQEEVEESNVQFSAWINQTTLSNEQAIDELVIHLELTKETAFLTIDLINAWILNDLTIFRMKRYIKTMNTLKMKIANVHKVVCT